MGFLNKSMDALGLPLEIPTYRETRAVLGADWSLRSNGQVIDPEVHTATASPTADGLWIYLSMLPQALGAACYERRVLAGIPNSAAKAREFLQTLTGYDFALLSQLQHSRGICAVTTSIYENLNPALSVVGMATKVAVGMVFATVTQSTTLRTLVRAVAAHNQVETALLDAAAQFATAEDDGELSAESSDATMAALLRVARAASTSPAKIDENVVTACRDASVSSAALVEVVSLVSALQLLYRLTEFYLPEEGAQAQE